MDVGIEVSMTHRRRTAAWLACVLATITSAVAGCGPRAGEFVAIYSKDSPTLLFELCGQGSIDQISVIEHVENGARWSALGPSVVREELALFSKPESWDLTADELKSLEPGQEYSLAVHKIDVPARTAHIRFTVEQLASLSESEVLAATGDVTKPVVLQRDEFKKRARVACDSKS